MLGWLDKLTKQEERERLGRRFEALTDEVFHVVRWTLIVGFARFLALSYPAVAFDILYWVLTAFLFGYLASRFLLRPEIRLFHSPARRWQRLVQSLVNFLVCMVVFALVLWGVEALTTAVADYRGAAQTGATFPAGDPAAQ